MKICVVGAGSLGSTIGGVLAQSGHQVTLLKQSQKSVDEILTSGLTLNESGQDQNIKVNAITALDITQYGVADLVIVLVKSFDTFKAMTAAKGLVGESTVVLSLQNGLGHEDILADIVGRSHVIAGKTYVGGVMQSNTYINSGVKGKHTIIGELDGRLTERVTQIATAFEAAGLITKVSSNIMGTIWDKLLVNVATGAISGVTGLTYGDLYQIPEVGNVAMKAVQEAINVAKANGIQLSIENPEAAWLLAKEGLSNDFKTSMLQSIERNAPTEIDFINGAVVRWGEKVSIETPYNCTLVACVKGIEARISQQANNKH